MTIAFVQANRVKGSGSLSSLSVTLSGVTAGDFLWVCVTGYQGVGTPTAVTASDTASTSYSAAGFASRSGQWIGNLWGVAAAGGSLTITVTPNASSDIQVGVCEYSFGGSIVAGTPVTGTGGSGGSFATGAVSFSGTGNYLLCGSFTAGGGSSNTWTAGSGFTARETEGSTAGGNFGIIMEDIVDITSSSSPLAATCTCSPGSPWAGIGVAFQEVPPSFSPWIFGDQIQDWYG